MTRIAATNPPFGDVVRWTPNFQASGLTFTGTGETHPAYNSYYVKNGHMVSFWIKIDLSTVTYFGTSQIKVDLPYAPHSGTMNHFSGWVWYTPNGSPDAANHIILNVDHLPGSQTMDLHWLGADTPTPKPVREYIFTPASPYTLTTASQVYINGTYFTDSM